jgi:MoaA/NifB/PqqE/SkfB family radical SAM enzyme
MSNLAAILSLLHEPTSGSATRLFRRQPVLQWTLQRLNRCKRLHSIGILCWDDQLATVAPIAMEQQAFVLAKGPRKRLPELDSISAARRWADGWRGGLLATCHFDLGFHGPWHQELLQRIEANAALLVDPSAGLIDPELIDGLIAHHQSHPEQEFCFAPAAPGLGALLLTRGVLDRLATSRAHPGQLMHYHPDRPSREPLAAESCAPVASSLARTLDRFTLDSDRQVRRIEIATQSLNGQLISTGAEDLVRRVHACRPIDSLPREIVLELNTARSTRPIFWPGRTTPISRPDLSIEHARRLFSELAGSDDIRLTLSGLGDPLLCNDLFAILDIASAAQASIHLETDLCDVTPQQLAQLAASPVDIISVHLPALSAQKYAAVMGCDGYARVVENIRQFLIERQRLGGSIPLVVPIFTKCRENFAEMEPWYDQWLRALGSAVIRGPSTCAGQFPDVSVADMTPPGRRPCGRIASRITILSDGQMVSCEEDIFGLQVLGKLGQDSLTEVWQNQFESLRKDHREGKWATRPLCGRCNEWHRS